MELYDASNFTHGNNQFGNRYNGKFSDTKWRSKCEWNYNNSMVRLRHNQWFLQWFVDDTKRKRHKQYDSKY